MAPRNSSIRGALFEVELVHYEDELYLIWLKPLGVF